MCWSMTPCGCPASSPRRGRALRSCGELVAEEWTHVCTSIDATAGQVLVMVDGEVDFSGVHEFLKNSAARKPVSAVNST